MNQDVKIIVFLYISRAVVKLWKLSQVALGSCLVAFVIKLTFITTKKHLNAVQYLGSLSIIPKVSLISSGGVHKLTHEKGALYWVQLCFDWCFRLSNLTSVGKEFVVMGRKSLCDVPKLNHLIFMMKDFAIKKILVLTDISGLQNLTIIDCNFRM